MQLGSEFLPANQDGSLELLLDCVDDFVDADHPAGRRAYVDEKVVETRYHNELPLTYNGDSFLTALPASITTRRYKGQGNVRVEYHATFVYVDETQTPLYGQSYFAQRFVGDQLGMSAHRTADEVDGALQQCQPGVTVPDLWYDGTEYDVQAFADELDRLQKQVAWATRR